MDSLLQLLLFGGAMFLMMRFGCGSHMFGHRAGDKDKSGAGEGGGGCCGGGDKKKSGGDMVAGGNTLPKIAGGDKPPKHDADPVCGKTVATDVAKTNLHQGLVYFFCSTECRDTFEASPEKYALKPDPDDVHAIA